MSTVIPYGPVNSAWFERPSLLKIKFENESMYDVICRTINLDPSSPAIPAIVSTLLSKKCKWIERFRMTSYSVWFEIPLIEMDRIVLLPQSQQRRVDESKNVMWRIKLKLASDPIPSSDPSSPFIHVVSHLPKKEWMKRNEMTTKKYLQIQRILFSIHSNRL